MPSSKNGELGFWLAKDKTGSHHGNGQTHPSLSGHWPFGQDCTTLGWRTTRTRMKRWSSCHYMLKWEGLICHTAFLFIFLVVVINDIYLWCFLHFATQHMTSQTSHISLWLNYMNQFMLSLHQHDGVTCGNTSSKNHCSQMIPLMHAHVSHLK